MVSETAIIFAEACKLATAERCGMGYALGKIISDLIDAGGFTWPTVAVDGTWVNFNANPAIRVGGFNASFRTMPEALSSVGFGTKLRFKPGSTNWTGTLSKKLLIDSPFGLTRIGAS